MRILLAALLALASTTHPYVTSAILEYMADDKGGFYLNGSPILEKSAFCPFDFNILSTSDGTLPMELFNNFGENVLGVACYDTRGGNMMISYRFTVHQSDGDPIVIWSVPDQAKMLHLAKEQRPPANWANVDFDDSSWKPAVEVTTLSNNYVAFPRLVDQAFAGFMGMDPFVPALGHVFNASCTTGDHNYFRSKFRFPDKPAKVQALINPPQAVMGQKVAARLIPGPDTSEYSQFNILAWLPKGLDLAQASPGGKFDPALRRIAWNFGAKDLEVRYSKMGVKSVVVDGGWANMNVMLGREKQGKLREQLNTPQYLWDEGAVMSPNRASWFKMEPHTANLTAGRPLIKGLIFHSQIKLGGVDNLNVREADFLRLNYSVDGSTKGALKDDVVISRGSHNSYWFDGYYDATEDRQWTWEDVSKLMVKLESRPKGSPDKNRIASVVATVKYYNPAKASPYFFANVTDPNCATLEIKTGVFRVGSPLTSSDPVDLPINQARCAPTPVPRPTSTPIPVAKMVRPTPQPVDTGLKFSPTNKFRLTGLSLNPEPFTYAGTFVSFSIKAEGDITLNVYDNKTGKLVRRMKAGNFRPGDNNQFFFNALDDNGKILVPGEYTFELEAQAKDGYKEVRNATFRFIKKGRR